MFDFPISANPPIGIFFRRTVFITFVHRRMFKTTAHALAPPHRIPAFHMQDWNPITFSSFRPPAVIFLLHPPHPISIVPTEQSPCAFYAWSHNQRPANILLPTDDLPFRCHRHAYCRISPVYHVLIHRSQMTSLLF